MSVPKYIKDAQNKYNSKFDLVQVKLPKGTKDRIKSVSDKSLNAFIRDLVLEKLEYFDQRESFQTNYDLPAEQEDDYDSYTIDGPEADEALGLNKIPKKVFPEMTIEEMAKSMDSSRISVDSRYQLKMMDQFGIENVKKYCDYLNKGKLRKKLTR